MSRELRDIEDRLGRIERALWVVVRMLQREHKEIEEIEADVKPTYPQTVAIRVRQL